MSDTQEVDESNWMISTIEKGTLFLGSVYAAEDEEVIQEYQIKSVLSILGYEVYLPSVIKEKKWIVLEDSSNENISSYFTECFRFIDNAPKPVLVHCEMGVSRSATIVIGYLMYKGKTLKEAYEYVQQKRKNINPNNGFMYQLYKYSEELYPHNEETMLFIFNKYGRKDTVDKFIEGDKKKAESFVNLFSECGFMWGNYFKKNITININK